MIILKEDDLLTYSTPIPHLHGINLPEALALNTRLGISLHDHLLFIGIEIGDADEFGAGLSAELSSNLDDICHNVLQAIYRFLNVVT